MILSFDSMINYDPNEFVNYQNHQIEIHDGSQILCRKRFITTRIIWLINPFICIREAAKSASNSVKLSETEASFIVKKTEFEKLRSDVQIKLKFLDENRVKVMQNQLLLFHNAVAAYFSGNQTALEAVMKQFSIKVRIKLN